MEIQKTVLDRKIQNAAQSAQAEQPGMKSGPGGRKCIYFENTACSPSFSSFEVCSTCPYGYVYCFSKVVKNVYQKVVSFAVEMLRKEISFDSLIVKKIKDK